MTSADMTSNRVVVQQLYALALETQAKLAKSDTAEDTLWSRSPFVSKRSVSDRHKQDAGNGTTTVESGDSELHRLMGSANLRTTQLSQNLLSGIGIMMAIVLRAPQTNSIPCPAPHCPSLETLACSSGGCIWRVSHNGCYLHETNDGLAVGVAACGLILRADIFQHAMRSPSPLHTNRTQPPSVILLVTSPCSPLQN